MEALALFKFWKSAPSTTAKVACGTTVSASDDCDDSSVTTSSSNILDQAKLGSKFAENNDISDSDDDDDSFFELELTLPDYNLQFARNEGDSHHFAKNDPEVRRNSYDSDIDSVHWTPINSLFEKSKPQSPIPTFRRSASPKLRVLMFGKLLKSKVHKSEDTEAAAPAAEIESVCSTYTTPRHSQSEKRQQKRNLFTVNLKMDDSSVIPKKFPRSNSSRISTSSSSSSSSPKHTQSQCVDFDGGLSKRFSKDSIQKYFNIIKKPLHGKSPRKVNGETVKVMDLFSGSELTSGSFPSPSSMCSPKKATNGKESERFRVVRKHLGKSKSASAMAAGRGATSPASRHAARRCEEGDGIEGAILHCKRSLNSSCKEPSLLSRCTSDPSHEKPILMMYK